MKNHSLLVMVVAFVVLGIASIWLDSVVDTVIQLHYLNKIGYATDVKEYKEAVQYENLDSTD